MWSPYASTLLPDAISSVYAVSSALERNRSVSSAWGRFSRDYPLALGCRNVIDEKVDWEKRENNVQVVLVHLRPRFRRAHGFTRDEKTFRGNARTPSLIHLSEYTFPFREID